MAAAPARPVVFKNVRRSWPIKCLPADGVPSLATLARSLDYFRGEVDQGRATQAKRRTISDANRGRCYDGHARARELEQEANGMANKGQMRLGAFFNPTGHHVASWR